MEKNKKIVLIMILLLQTIVIVAMSISSYKNDFNKECNNTNNCDEQNENQTVEQCKTEYKYLCSKETSKKDGFVHNYYEEYTVDKMGLITSRVTSNKYTFSTKEEYEMQKDNFKPMENYEIKKDDEKMEIVIYKEEEMISQEIWYRLLEQNLEERSYSCEEISD